MTTAAEPIRTLMLCGSGLSLWMTVAALSRSLPATIDIKVAEIDSNPTEDAFYGQLLPPAAYRFHLSIDLSEPELLLNTGSTFAYGTYLHNWASTDRSWVQAFHQPLMILEGVPLAKLIQQDPSLSLQDMLISAQAALGGVFAHPPENATHPLSRAEYGYAFDPKELTALYKAVSLARSIQLIKARIDQVERNSTGITSVTLSDGHQLSADLFVDCSGPSATLLSPSKTEAKGSRTVQALISRISDSPVGKAAQTIKSGDYGWQSEVTLRSGARRMTVFHEDSRQIATAAHGTDPDASITLSLGCRENPWAGNCVAIGQAACTVEPLTTAPMKLLLRDIQRLMDLFPVSTDMQIEALEYNRVFHDDVCHAKMFNQAHFALPSLPNGPYWQAAAAQKQPPKLSRKLIQYESRGYFVAYDDEPFDDVDWAILHDGMERRPRRRDPLASMAEPAKVIVRLEQQQTSIQSILNKMPPHSVYVSKFLSYLHRKHSHNG